MEIFYCEFVCFLGIRDRVRFEFWGLVNNNFYFRGVYSFTGKVDIVLLWEEFNGKM